MILRASFTSVLHRCERLGIIRTHRLQHHSGRKILERMRSAAMTSSSVGRRRRLSGWEGGESLGGGRAPGLTQPNPWPATFGQDGANAAHDGTFMITRPAINEIPLTV
jgi:hypothetical protein